MCYPPTWVMSTLWMRYPPTGEMSTCVDVLTPYLGDEHFW